MLNAYALAASEENAAGHRVVTAPTSGSSGIIPGIIYFALKHLGISRELIREGLLVASAIGASIGFYDGVLGPGTGTFLVFSLVGLLGYDFLRASAKAKIVNFATNLGALLFFIPLGAVLWPLGLVMGAANVAGSLLGSRMAIAKGTRFIRALFLIVVAVLIVKLGLDIWAEAA